MRTPRCNSPSAINTLNKCRRKYYYKYKLGIPENTSIEMVLGNLVHKAIKLKADDSNRSIESIFDSLWKDKKAQLSKFRIPEPELKKLYQDYRNMALNWEKDFDPEAEYECELPLTSEKYKVIGIIDEKSRKNGKVRILDNKTCKNYGISKDHEIQLAIYALLHQEKFGKLPDYIGIRFLRDGSKQYIPVNDKLISKAIYECKMMRVKNLSDNIVEYPRSPSPLCNWGKGKCTYLERCYP